MRLNTAIFLTMLAFALICVALGFAFARKLKLKQVGCAVILVAALFYRLFIGIGEQFSFDDVEWIGYNPIPFAAMAGLPESYYFNGFAAAFILALLWGIFAPVLFNLNSTGKYVTLTVCVVLPVELLILILYFIGISMGVRNDTAAIIFSAAGCALGYYINRLFVKLMQNKERRQ